MNIMHHRGYEAVIEFDEEAEIFHGEVVNMRDVITFQGASAAELKQAFAESLDDYLVFCAERGEQPERPFSGQFVVRADPKLHKALSSAAQRDGVSLNKWVTSALERAVG
ncbi:type II toxin-antitoxin system HicB family antitoxin [Rhizobium esperanzae]|uniref:Putative HicB family RNase H-like nuclease n=1 Tax=Rhizobium esperanzae TaxID=1967781 RepID=A0A7W6W345_9HYPH|nr:type II toxin-antitoxin system HicB family antitoxin [Rhizobium esperanzae]MBB4233625.1 putative HicB family RNase H-like nuclease [Rhizobium esperanzae]